MLSNFWQRYGYQCSVMPGKSVRQVLGWTFYVRPILYKAEYTAAMDSQDKRRMGAAAMCITGWKLSDADARREANWHAIRLGRIRDGRAAPAGSVQPIPTLVPPPEVPGAKSVQLGSCPCCAAPVYIAEFEDPFARRYIDGLSGIWHNCPPKPFGRSMIDPPDEEDEQWLPPWGPR